MREELPSRNIRILIADDHPLLRLALREVLERASDLEVVGEAGDGEETVKLSLELVPDLVIVDMNMPKINGLEVVRQIRAQDPNVKVLVLTVYDESEQILSMIEAGATGYLTKRVFGDEVVEAVRSVVAGETVLSPDVAKRIFKYGLRYSSKRLPPDMNERISEKELDILRLLALGMSNRAIANMRGLSIRTVKGYLEEIFDKLGASNRTEAVITALRSGLISMEDLT